MTVSAELPRYQSHKKVWALKIAKVEHHYAGEGDAKESLGTATLTPMEEGYAPFDVDADWIGRHGPFAGGYYVVYEDGYKSFSPSKAFESGYERI